VLSFPRGHPLTLVGWSHCSSIMCDAVAQLQPTLSSRRLRRAEKRIETEYHSRRGDATTHPTEEEMLASGAVRRDTSRLLKAAASTKYTSRRQASTTPQTLPPPQQPPLPPPLTTPPTTQPPPSMPLTPPPLTPPLPTQSHQRGGRTCVLSMSWDMLGDRTMPGQSMRGSSSCPSIVLALSWHCPGIVLTLSWHCPGIVLTLHCPGNAKKKFYIFILNNCCATQIGCNIVEFCYCRTMFYGYTVS
jgi:hypothetical protein